MGRGKKLRQSLSQFVELGCEGRAVFEAAQVEQKPVFRDAADHRLWQAAQCGGERIEREFLCGA